MAFLSNVHSFRAVAILFIVAGHCIYLFEWQGNERTEQLLKSVFQNGTVLFVFVAGFLFQHLSGRFDYRKYLRSKLRNVISPYVVVSLPMILLQGVTGRGSFDPANGIELPGMAAHVLFNLLTGFHILPFWFIPMISVFYLLAPVLVAADREGRAYAFLPVLLVMTCFVHRPSQFTHVWHSCLYFFPVYLFGMWFSRYRERLLAWHDRWLAVVGGIYLGLVALEVLGLDRGGALYSRQIFSTEQGVFDTNALQKLVLCGLLLVVLQRLDRWVAPWLNRLADLSFGIFFLHMYFIQAYARLVLGEVFPAGGVLRFLGLVGVVVLLSMLCLEIAKKVLGRQSRRVVGS